MRRSFRRLIAASVLMAWLLGFVVIMVWSRTKSWTQERAQGDAIFLFHELLDQTPAADRAERLAELQAHSRVELSLVSVDDVERRVGRAVHPGERIPYRENTSDNWYFWVEEWYLMVFDDGEGALSAGPVNPALPRGIFPIGLIVAIIGLPAIAALVALRVERELTKVERATEALGVGELSARVEDARGPSHELADKFNAMAEKVERLIRSRDELIQAVSHELGSPLSRLRFHMELLERQSEDERDQRLSAMTRELDAVDELVAELLTYVQSEDLQLEARRFDPSQGLRDLAELAVLEAPEDRVVDIQTSLPPGVEVYADQRLFLRAVENILRNAMRYARHDVRLELLSQADRVRVTVHDDGPGIPTDVRDKIMLPFVRLEADRGRKTGGVGLGLAIVSRIVNRHGGSVEIGDSPLGGATVSTSWPTRDSRG
ncbi:MAG: hypothetical protein K0V04_13795 [Deltaproteobacteria bacterium]|nr:hypothetical protein [Deltaproteobacteria bacterium]